MDPINPKDSKRATIRIPSTEIQFDKSKYDHDVLGRHISKEKFEEIVDKLNKISVKAFFQARRHKGSIYPSTMRILSIAVVLNIILLIIGSFEGISIAVSVLFIIAINALIILLIVMIYLTPITRLSKSDLCIKDIIDKHLIDINNEYLNKLQWRYDALDKALMITAV